MIANYFSLMINEMALSSTDPPHDAVFGVGSERHLNDGGESENEFGASTIAFRRDEADLVEEVQMWIRRFVGHKNVDRCWA